MLILVFMLNSLDCFVAIRSAKGDYQLLNNIDSSTQDPFPKQCAHHEQDINW